MDPIKSFKSSALKVSVTDNKVYEEDHRAENMIDRQKTVKYRQKNE